jgi:hypothetical protein
MIQINKGIVAGNTMAATYQLNIHNVRFQVLTMVSMKFRVFWDVAPCTHIEVDRRFRGTASHHQGTLMMQAVCTSETSVNFNVTTWHYIPEDPKLKKSIMIFKYSVKKQCQCS